MSHPHLFKSSLGRSGFSRDLQLDVIGRLRVLAWLTSGMWFLAFLLYTFVFHPLSGQPIHFYPQAHIPCAIGIAISLLLIGLTKQPNFTATRLLDIALVYEIVMGWLITTADATRLAALQPDEHMGVSWVCVWILLFPMIVPHDPRKVFAAALLTALADPALGGIIWWMEHAEIIPAKHWAFWWASFACAFLAILPAKIIHALSEKVSNERELGSYRLIELIGAGGMGEVWKASHRMLKRASAVKIIRPESLSGNRETSEILLKRFEREAQATAQLKSPHSIQIFDFGLSDDGTFYYVMELLEGIDLDTLVKDHGPLRADRAIHFLIQAAHSLADAHASKMIHRDVKPANLFTCVMGQDHDFLKVLDFGLVKTFSSADAQITQDQISTGTPAFMAPEQAIGSKSADHRVDIYALGAVAYWLVTGELVFGGETPMEMILNHAKEPPVAPSSRTELEIPIEFEEIILACLAKDPAERPASATELGRRLEALPVDRWNEAQARSWWATHAPVQRPSQGSDETTASILLPAIDR